MLYQCHHYFFPTEIKQRKNDENEDAKRPDENVEKVAEERTRRPTRTPSSPSSVPTRDGGNARDSTLPKEQGTTCPQVAVCAFGARGCVRRL